MFSEVREPSRSSQDNSARLLSAIMRSVATDNSHLKTVLDILESVLPCEDEGFEWVKEMKEDYLDLKLMFPPQLKRPRTGEILGESPFCITKSESPELEVIRTYWGQLVTAVSSCVGSVSDYCLSEKLITVETYDNVHTCASSCKTQMLLISVRDTISCNHGCFESLLEVLKKTLLPEDQELVSDMKKDHLKLMSSIGLEEDLTSVTSKTNELDGLLGGSPEVIILQRFTADLVTAISGCIVTVTDQCYREFLISGSEQQLIMELLGSKDKARRLLMYVRRTIETDQRCFNLFQSVLKRTLLSTRWDTLSSRITDAYNKLCSSSSTSSDKAMCHRVRSPETAKVIKNLTYSMEVIADSKSEILRLEEELRLKEKENEQLKAQLEAMKAERLENVKADEEMMELKLKIKECESEIVTLNCKIEEQERIIDRHQMKVKREEAVAREENKAVTETLRAAAKAEQEMREKFQSLESEKNQLKANLEAQIDNLGGKICHLGGKIHDLERDNRILNRRLTSNGLRSSVTFLDTMFDRFHGIFNRQ